MIAENIKYGGKVLQRELIREIWMQEIMPEGWRKSIIVPLYKRKKLRNARTTGA